MFRLGTRADRKRTSLPPEASTSSFSLLMVLIETGTSWMFSTRRWAVTCTASRVVAAFSAGAGTAGAASWAKTLPNGNKAAMARASRCGRTENERVEDMRGLPEGGGRGKARWASTCMLQDSNGGGNGLAIVGAPHGRELLRFGREGQGLAAGSRSHQLLRQMCRRRELLNEYLT